MPSRGLDTYRRKRDPARTPEPFAAPQAAASSRRFVVQQHAARRNHWDLRLEIGGVLVSFAVPKGPSSDPQEKRLAVQTEDHPLEYADFEGVIPAGNYGAGAMIVWDRGVFSSVDDGDLGAGLDSGKLDLMMVGHKLRGRWALVRLKKGETGREWLLFKKADAYADGRDLGIAMPESVLSGLTVAELGEGIDRGAELGERAAAAGAPCRDLAARDLRPMLATPWERPFSGDDWLFELKYDGVRAVLERRDRAIALRTRRGRDIADAFPEILLAARHLPCASYAVDGEIVAVDDSGAGSFELLQQRLGLQERRVVERGAAAVPVLFQAFDLLAVAGRDTRALPLPARKELLRQLLPPRGTLRFADHVDGAGEALYALAAERHLEGIVAKRRDSVYQSGVRSPAWRKVKVPREADLVVVGYQPGKGSRHRLGSLLLAWWVDGELHYAGNVGSGLDDAAIDSVLAAGVERDAPACAAGELVFPTRARFLEPELVARVRYTEVTQRGSLRQPIFLGLRADGDARSCNAPVAQRSPLPPAADAATPDDGGVRPRFVASNQNKVFWPEDGFTKGDLLAYYEAIWPWLAPYLRDRPVVLTRYPDGIHGKSFFQKNAPDFVPEWVTTCRVEDTEYFLCNELDALLYVVNLGCIPLHMWSARRNSIEHPDWTILDLDPKGAPFDDVVQVARHIHALLDEVDVSHYLKTSGQDGLHILIPLAAMLTHHEARTFAEVIARLVVADLPEIATAARPLGERGGKVYVDFLQNGHGKTIAAPFSARPRPGAPVSLPLRWTQLTKRLSPAAFTIATAPGLMRAKGDPMARVLSEKVDVAGALHALQARVS